VGAGTCEAKIESLCGIKTRDHMCRAAGPQSLQYHLPAHFLKVLRILMQRSQGNEEGLTKDYGEAVTRLYGITQETKFA